MSLQLINDLYKQVRRLSIAGARLSRDDFRLRNALNELARIRDSSTVMQRLYASGTKVLESNEAEAGQNLLEFSNLLAAVMATQADTHKVGEIKPLINAPLGGSAEISYRKLYPAVEALSGAGAGRTRIIQEFIESGLPVDIRLIDLLTEGLSGYPEVADGALELLKRAGSRILPVVEEAFDVKGNKGDARKLLLIHHFARDARRDLYIEALNHGSKDVRASAMEILEQSREGAKIVRQFKRQREQSGEEKDERSRGGILNFRKLLKK